MSELPNAWSWRPWTWTTGERIWVFLAFVFVLFVVGLAARVLG